MFVLVFVLFTFLVFALFVFVFVLFTLLVFSLLPLLSLQSQLLFNRDFARVIALKLRRAEFLERILS